MTNEEKLELIADTLSVELSSIDENTGLCDIEEYDSMKKLSLIIMFVDNFEKKLTVNDINSLKTVNDIMVMMV